MKSLPVKSWVMWAIVAGGLMLSPAGPAYSAAQYPAEKPPHVPSGIQRLPEVVIYDEENFRGDWIRTNLRYPSLANLNNKVSSIIVVSGTWRFCKEYDFKDCKEFQPGYYERIRQSDIGLDTVSSFEPIVK